MQPDAIAGNPDVAGVGLGFDGAVREAEAEAEFAAIEVLGGSGVGDVEDGNGKLEHTAPLGRRIGRKFYISKRGR